MHLRCDNHGFLRCAAIAPSFQPRLDAELTSEVTTADQLTARKLAIAPEVPCREQGPANERRASNFMWVLDILLCLNHPPKT